jgi:hypothetical protein
MNISSDLPVISLAVSAKNNAGYLDSALDALGHQIRKEVEILVAIDSDEDSIAVMKKHQSSGFKFLLSTNCHTDIRSDAKSRMLLESSGRYILWIENGRVPLPELVDTLLEHVLKNSSTDLIITRGEEYKKHDEPLLPDCKASGKGTFGSTCIDLLTEVMGFSSTCVLINRSLYLDTADCYEKVLAEQGVEFWCRTLQNVKYSIIEKALCRIYKRNESFLQRNMNDFSHISYAVRHCTRRISLEKLFPSCNWSDPSRALTHAMSSIAKGFILHGDAYNAIQYFKCANVEYMSVEDMNYYLRVLFARGNNEGVRGLLCTIRRMVSGLSKEHIDAFHSEMCRNFEIQHEIANAYEKKNMREMCNHIRGIKKKINSTLQVLHIYAERFEKNRDKQRQRKYLESCVRMAPEKESYYNKLLSLAETEYENNEIKALRNRMLTEQPDAPLYFLSCLERHGRYFGIQ